MSRQVNFEQLFQGADANFELPAMQDPSQWGLFVCRDSRRTGECRQKPLTDVNRAFTEYHKAQQAGRRYTPEDRVYFFQYVLFEGNGTVSVFDHHEVPDENFTRLGDFVGQLAGGASLDEESTSALDFARTRTRDLRSLALKTQYSTLEVELPYASREACTPPR